MDGQFECNNDIYSHMKSLYESWYDNSLYSRTDESWTRPIRMRETLPQIAAEAYSSLIKSNTIATIADVLYIIETWSIGMSINEAMTTLTVPEETIRRVFAFCTTYAKSVLTSHKEEQLGGQYRIVVVDIYPSGCEKFGYPYRQQEEYIYFCMAELKDSPPNYQFERMDIQEKSSSRDDWIVKTLQRKIKPLTTIVIDTDVMLCDPRVLDVIKKLGTSFVSVESLKRHDTADKSVLNSLQTIWMPALQLCEEDYAEEHDS